MKIEIQELTKNFDGSQVLSVPSMILEPGLTCLLGPNGCGKSTLLNILSGQLTYEKGSVVYDGAPYSKNLGRRVTMVKQKPLMFDRSVYDNIAYPLKIRKVHGKEIHSRIDRVIRDFGLQDLRDNKATSLSGGETQKVALARAIVFEPDLLLLDEATANIDSQFTGQVNQMIRDYAKGTRTVLFVTHDPDQAEAIADRIVKL